jgi:hypothetical protein
MNIPDFDDKDLVIIAVLLITLMSLVILKGDAVTVVTSALSGLCGLAVGKKLE